MDEVAAAVEALESQRRRTLGVVAIHVAVYAAALLLFVFGRWTRALVVLAANLVLYFLIVRRVLGFYAQRATAANLRFGLCAGLEDMAYQPKGGMTQADLEQWAMLPLEGEGNGLLCRHYVTGRERDMDLACCEVTFHYAVDAVKRRDQQRFLSGTVLTARGRRDDRRGDWLLLSQSLLDAGAREAFLQSNGYHAAQGAPEGYALYAHRPDARLPDYLTRRVTKLCGEMKRLGALRLTQDGAAAYLDLRFYTGSSYPSTHPSAAQLRENTLAERDDLWDLFRFWFSAEER